MGVDFCINGSAVSVETDPSKPLLWVLREEFGLTGTKYGCGVGACGACTVHIDGQAARSGVLPVKEAAGHAVTTIEGLSAGQERRAVQQAWIEAGVPQCGYCQSGMIMAVAGLLASRPNPADDEIDTAITNIRRCGTYPRIRTAIRALADEV